jgi:hypothetical protein
MAWRVAKSLLKIREQFNQMSPRRNKSSDGTIGDAKHASRSSDHNPWVKDGKTGVVTAIDITHDPSNGVDNGKICEMLRVNRDPRIKYVISNGRIFSSIQRPWEWRKYTGSNPHRSHFHISVHSQKVHYDNANTWALGPASTTIAADPDDPKERPILRRGSTGELVSEVQTLLNLTVDGQFGPATEEAVTIFQKKAKLPVTDWGAVGTMTWTALDKIEQRNDGEHDGDMLEE